MVASSLCVRDTRSPGSLPRVPDVVGSFHAVLGGYGAEKGNAGTGAKKGDARTGAEGGCEGPEVTSGDSGGTRFNPGGLV